MKWTFALVCIAVFLCLSVPATAWTADLSVTSENRTAMLTLGSEQNASDGFDPQYDIPLPPSPPASSFDAYFLGSGLFEMLQTDIRSNQTWTLFAHSEDTITISWDQAPVPLTMVISGKEYAMNTPGESTWTAGTYQITIHSTGDTAGDTSSPSSADDSFGDADTTYVSSAPTKTEIKSDTIEDDTPSLPVPLETGVTTADISPDATHLQQTLSATESANRTPGFSIEITLLGLIALIICRKRGQ